MKNWSIVTKIVASTSGIVCLLVLLGGYILIRFEIRMVDTFTDEILRGYHELINDREMEEKRSLKQSITFGNEILNGIGAAYLYNLDQEGLKQSLRPFMNYEQIDAIKVLDERGKPFAAAWRNPNVEIGNALPEDLDLNKDLSTRMECVRDDKKIGGFQIFYSDAVLKRKIQALKQEASLDANKFEATSRSQLEGAIVSQSIGVFLILFVLVISLIFFLRALVLKPLKSVSNVARQLSDFNLAVSIDTRRKDEVGRFAQSHRRNGGVLSNGSGAGPAIRHTGHLFIHGTGRHRQGAGDHHGQPTGIHQQGGDVRGGDFPGGQ